MKVYIVLVHYGYGSSTSVDGVYDSYEKAEDVLNSSEAITFETNTGKKIWFEKRIHQYRFIEDHEVF